MAPRRRTKLRAGFTRTGQELSSHGSCLSQYTLGVSAIDPASELAGLTVLSPDEALRRAKPMPQDTDLEIDGLTDAEWTAFEKALTDR